MWLKNNLNVLRSGLYRVPDFPAFQTKKPQPWPDLPKRTKRIEIATRDRSLLVGRQAVEDRQNISFNHLAERGTTCSLAAPLSIPILTPVKCHYRCLLGGYSCSLSQCTSAHLGGRTLRERHLVDSWSNPAGWSHGRTRHNTKKLSFLLEISI